jgi:DNA modification methylase
MKAFYDEDGVTLLNCDALAGLRSLPDASVQCCVTSPPYWGLRDYGVVGQIGLERTPEAYVARLVEVFREVWRVLKDDGTLWLNLGDSYATNGGHADAGVVERRARIGAGERPGEVMREVRNRPTGGLKPKDLVGIPWSVAFALRADGWYLRSDIIWAKPAPMPESVTDRPTRSHEYIFLLSKSERYCYDHEAIQERSVSGDPRKPYAPGQVDARGDGHARNGGAVRPSVKRGGFNGKTEALAADGRNAFRAIEEWRNKRDVWSVNSEPNSWTETAHRVRVEVDAPCDGSESITSPDCPLHGDYSALVSNASYGGRGAGQLSGNGHIANGPEPIRQVDCEQSVPPRVGCYERQSSDWQGRPCEPSATVHNNQSRRMAPAPLTNSPCTPFEETSSRIECRLASLSDLGSDDRIAESSTAVDFVLDAQDSDPSEQTRSRIAHRCTCKHYITRTEKTAHFAVFPEALIEPCVKAGCPAGGTVLDPFAGSGTTGVVAKRFGCQAVLIELSADYCAIASKRLSQGVLALGTPEPPPQTWISIGVGIEALA